MSTMAEISSLPRVDGSVATDQQSKDTLSSILHAHHVEHSLLWDMGKFINIAPEHKDLGIHIVHSPHLLASLSMLGATPQRLQEVYQSESKILLAPETPKGTITKENWRAYLGNRKYTCEYLDFFTRELDARPATTTTTTTSSTTTTTKGEGDWRALINEYLFSGPNPLFKSVTGDLNHPLIHLAYAYELRNAELATDALTYCAVHYDPKTEKYLDARDTSQTTTTTTAAAAGSPLEVFANIRNDARLDGFPPGGGRGREHFGPLLEQHEAVVLEHWRSWPPPAAAPAAPAAPGGQKHTSTLTTAQFTEAFDACIALLVGTVQEGEAYDFILLHALTGCHALRVLLPELPAEHHWTLFNQWWLATITMYITQGRKQIDEGLFATLSLDGMDWSSTIKLATEGPAGFDAHYVKAIRAIKTASELVEQVPSPHHDHPPGWYLKAATRFAETFRSYGGFGPVDEDMIVQLMAMSGQGSSERH